MFFWHPNTPNNIKRASELHTDTEVKVKFYSSAIASLLRFIALIATPFWGPLFLDSLVAFVIFVVILAFSFHFGSLMLNYNKADIWLFSTHRLNSTIANPAEQIIKLSQQFHQALKSGLNDLNAYSFDLECWRLLQKCKVLNDLTLIETSGRAGADQAELAARDIQKKIKRLEEIVKNTTDRVIIVKTSQFDEDSSSIDQLLSDSISKLGAVKALGSSSDDNARGQI